MGRVLRIALVLAVMLPTGAVAVSLAGARSARPARSAPRVTVVGDSVAAVLDYVPQARELLGRDLDLRLELAVCRRLVSDSCPYGGVRPPTALDVVKGSTPGQLGDILVVDVGYNDPAVDYETDMVIFMRAVAERGVSHVIWVTLREDRADYRAINRAIRQAPARWPVIQVADWDGVSRGHEDWFNPDGLHLTGSGAMGLASFLRTFVLTVCGDACASTSPPPDADAVEPPQSRRSPSIRGTSRVGRMLACGPGAWLGARPIRFSYTWLRNRGLITGAGARGYRLRGLDRGALVKCRVQATNGAGSASADSAPVRVRR